MWWCGGELSWEFVHWAWFTCSLFCSLSFLLISASFFFLSFSSTHISIHCRWCVFWFLSLELGFARWCQGWIQGRKLKGTHLHFLDRFPFFSLIWAILDTNQSVAIYSDIDTRNMAHTTYIHTTFICLGCTVHVDMSSFFTIVSSAHVVHPYIHISCFLSFWLLVLFTFDAMYIAKFSSFLIFMDTFLF